MAAGGSEPRNTLRGRIARHTRELGLFAALSVGAVGVLIALIDGNWLVVATATIAVCVIVWLVSANVSATLLRELSTLITTIKEFNGGNKSVRALRIGSTGTSELRQLTEQFNRMAEESEAALREIHAEDRRESHFVSDVSHELRTPLTSIRGAAETLLEGDVEEADQSRFLNMIVAESARLSRLANDLLTLQRIEGGTGEIRLSRFDLDQAVERAEATLGPLIEARGVQFEMRVAGRAESTSSTGGMDADSTLSSAVPTVLGDIDRIQQIVVNLVDNASRVVGEGGKVWIEFATIARSELGPLVHEPGLADTEQFALLQVSDNGPGVPEEDIPRLFDRFYRHQYSRDRKTGGSGLGLSIVKAIVSSHSGAIAVCNRMDAQGQLAGADFMVYLPIPPEPDIERLARLPLLSKDSATGRGLSRLKVRRRN